VFVGTRVPLKNLMDYLEGGPTVNGFPSVSREHVVGALQEAQDLLSARAGAA